MKSTNYIINGLLAVAVIILFILQFSSKKNGKDPAADAGDSCSLILPVAYVDTDSLLMNYDFAKELHEALMSKMEKSRASLNQKGQQLSAELVEFENKVNNNAFLNRERAVSEQQRLEKKQRDFQELVTRSQNEMEMERLKVNQQLTDTVIAALEKFNVSKKYQLIFSRNDNILLADGVYNITKDVLDFLNARYKPEKK